MKKSISILGISAFACLLVAGGGCTTTPIETIDEATPMELSMEDDGLEWIDVEPGIRMADDGETRRWRVEGTEAQAAFRNRLEDLRVNESSLEGREFFNNVIDGIDEYQKNGATNEKPATTTTPSAMYRTVEITPIAGGLRAHARAERGWGYVRAYAYVNINGTVKSEAKSKADSCIYNCYADVTQEVSSCPSQQTSCYAYASAQTGGTLDYVERITCSPVTCTATPTCRTTCNPGECGNVSNGCGGWLYCGQCGTPTYTCPSGYQNCGDDVCCKVGKGCSGVCIYAD